MSSVDYEQGDVSNGTLDCQQDSFCPEYDHNRWIYPTILYFGSIISIVSLLENALIFYSIFIDRQRRFSTYFVFLLLWSVFDMFVSAMYIPVIVIDHARDQMNSPVLQMLWASYYDIGLAFVGVALTAGCYLIVCLQLERYALVLRVTALHAVMRDHRLKLCLGAIAAAAVMKAPVYFEFSVKAIPENACNITGYVVVPNERLPDAYRIYSFWLRNTLTIFVPFCAMLVLNVLIVLRLNKTSRMAHLFRLTNSDHKIRAREATRTFLVIVTSYLLSNSLQLTITVMEFAAPDLLFGRLCYYYLIGSDMVTILTMLCCGSRLWIYLKFNAELRHVIAEGSRSVLSLCLPNPINRHSRTRVEQRKATRADGEQQPAAAATASNGLPGVALFSLQPQTAMPRLATMENFELDCSTRQHHQEPLATVNHSLSHSSKDERL